MKKLMLLIAMTGLFISGMTAFASNDPWPWTLTVNNPEDSSYSYAFFYNDNGKQELLGTVSPGTEDTWVVDNFIPHYQLYLDVYWGNNKTTSVYIGQHHGYLRRDLSYKDDATFIPENGYEEYNGTETRHCFIGITVGNPNGAPSTFSAPPTYPPIVH